MIDNCKEEKLLYLQTIKITSNKIEKVTSNKPFYEFLKKHSFKQTAQDLKKFVNKLSEKYFAQGLKISLNDKIEINGIVKATYDINGIFWHDSLIFKFIQELKEFVPGFIRINYLEIDKITKISNLRPAIRMELKCEYYSAK
jgi:hypothetical protein